MVRHRNEGNRDIRQARRYFRQNMPPVVVDTAHRVDAIVDGAPPRTPIPDPPRVRDPQSRRPQTSRPPMKVMVGLSLEFYAFERLLEALDRETDLLRSCPRRGMFPIESTLFLNKASHLAGLILSLQTEGADMYEKSRELKELLDGMYIDRVERERISDKRISECIDLWDNSVIFLNTQWRTRAPVEVYITIFESMIDVLPKVREYIE